MAKKSLPNKTRRPRGLLLSYTLNHIHLHNPFMVMWWSAAMPGFGHIALCKYIKGFSLLLFEILINVNGHLNLAIVYTFLGEFEQAKEVLDMRWVLVYAPVWLYGMWDSYRASIDLNKLFLLADKEGSAFPPVNISALEINYLDDKSPWMSVIWTMLMPGLGHLYVNRLISGFLFLIWFLVDSYRTGFCPAIVHSLTGSYQIVAGNLDPEWMLFLPSIYGFSAYDAYFNSREMNSLFIVEQSRFLQNEYQDVNFSMPI